MENKFRFKIKTFVAVGAILLAVVSCAKDEQEMQYSSTMQSKVAPVNETDMITLGSLINDPYNYENMLAALEQLKQEDVELPFESIEPTGVYVKVLPQDDDALDALEADTSIIWLDYPLHYEVSGGCYYHDNSVSDSNLTWLYGVVPIGYKFPAGVTVSTIYDVFIPEDDDETYDLLEDKSLEMTENIKVNLMPTDEIQKTSANKFTPSATIQAYDDTLKAFLPLQGVKVVAKLGVKTKKGFTNSNGVCVVNGKFKKPVNYSVKWESEYWDIRGKRGQAYTTGPKMQGQWNLKIYPGGQDIMFATIHCAAYKFFYGDHLGIKRPYLNVGKLKIKYHHESWPFIGFYRFDWNIFGLRPNIDIWGYDNNSESYRSDEIFGSVIHCLGYISHKNYLGNNKFQQTNPFIVESWASCIECALTDHYYKVDHTLTTQYKCSNGFQYWIPTGTIFDYYTPVFIDLMDSYNQYYNVYYHFIKDEISGYTLREIQDSIISEARDLASLRTVLKKRKMHGATDAQIDTLLAKYEGLNF
ncbi:MAG: hypothetical protein IJ684_00950 [Bacteroidales bacterium]|nr:hypothetical protein [Bacteroidales bacterium]